MSKLPLTYQLVKGAIGKERIVKHYSYGIVVTPFPDMSGIIATKKQLAQRNLFREAVAYARNINNDAGLKKLWTRRIKNGTVYNAAIKEYMLMAKRASEALPADKHGSGLVRSHVL